MYNSLAILSIYDTISLLLTEANPISKGGKKCQINLKKADMLARNLLLKICANLIEFLNKIIFSEDFLSRHRRSEKDFIRDRLLPFHNMIFFLMNMIKGSLQDMDRIPSPGHRRTNGQSSPDRRLRRSFRDMESSKGRGVPCCQNLQPV